MLGSVFIDGILFDLGRPGITISHALPAKMIQC
jgi:hypothetical protein